jgi:hypothetical protein
VLSNQINKGRGTSAKFGMRNSMQAPIRSSNSRASGHMHDMDDEEMDYGAEEVMDQPGMQQPRGIPQFNEAEYDDEDEDIVPEIGDDDLTFPEFEKIINTEGVVNNKVTELRKASYIKKGTQAYHMVKAVQTGDEAISFFAKHGTNMPVKFLNCNRQPQ